MTPFAPRPIAEGTSPGPAAADVVDRLRTRNGSSIGFGIGPVCDEAADEIERLRAQVAALQADAERYRWLRERFNWKSAGEGVYEWGLPHFVVQRIFGGESDFLQIDQRIDAARKD